MLVLGSASLVASFGNYIWLFFLPTYYSTVFGASPFGISIVYTGWFAAAAIGTTPAGALADRYGRKPVVLTGSLISAFGTLLLAFSHTFVLAAVAFVFVGLGSGFIQIQHVIITESVESERRGTAMGVFQTFTFLTTSLSPIIGGVTLYNTNDYFILFIFGAALSLVATLARALFVRETLDPANLRKESGEKSQSFLHNLNTIFSDRVLVMIIVAYALYNLFIDQQSFVIPLYTNNVLGLNYESMGGLFAILILVSALSRLPFGKLSDKIGRLQTIAISWIGESTFVFVFVFAPRGDLAVAMFGIALWTLFGVMDGPAVNAWVADRANPKARGISMGIFFTGSAILALPGILVAGVLFSIQPRLPFYANSVLGFACLIMLLLLNRSKTIRGGSPTADHPNPAGQKID